MRLPHILAIVLLILCAGFGAAQTNRQELDKKELEALARTEKAQQAAKAKFQKAPRDASLRKSYLDLTYKLGYDTMISPAIDSKERYPKALRLFREVLQVDPNHKLAKHWRDEIERIYRSLNRPIPK
jgi:tetratricopeptide (TPR) repeat protein